MKFFNKKGVKSIILLLLVSFIVVPLLMNMLNVKTVEGYEDQTQSQTQTQGQPQPQLQPQPEAQTQSQTQTQTQNQQPQDGAVPETPGENTENIQNETNPGVVPSNIDYVDRIVNNEGKHMYCLGGNVYCKYDNAELQYVENYEFGKTYKDKCSDGSKAICNNYMRNEDVSELKFYEYNKETKQPVEGSKVEYKESEEYVGFTNPLDYTPLDLKGNQDFMIYYKPNGEKHKTDRCALFGPDKCIQGNVEDSSGACPDSVEIKCLANYGTKVGDPLCCGQTGVLQNTNHVCPEEMPACAGYKCGSQWGVCMKHKPEPTPTEVETNPEATPQ